MLSRLLRCGLVEGRRVFGSGGRGSEGRITFTRFKFRQSLVGSILIFGLKYFSSLKTVSYPVKDTEIKKETRYTFTLACVPIRYESVLITPATPTGTQHRTYTELCHQSRAAIIRSHEY